MSVPDVRWWFVAFITMPVFLSVGEWLWPVWGMVVAILTWIPLAVWCFGQRTWDSRVIGLSFEERVARLKDYEEAKK